MLVLVLVLVLLVLVLVLLVLVLVLVLLAGPTACLHQKRRCSPCLMPTTLTPPGHPPLQFPPTLTLGLIVLAAVCAVRPVRPALCLDTVGLWLR